MRRVLIGSLLAVLLLPPLLLLGLAATETGSSVLLQAGSRLVPGLTVAGVQGTLLREIRLNGIDYRDDAGLQVQLDTLFIHWRPLGLLDGRLQLRATQASGLLLTLPPPVTKPGPETEPEQQYPIELPQSIVPPLAIQLDLLTLDRVQVRQQQAQWQLDHLELSARLGHDGLHIDKLQFEGEGVQMEASGEADGAYPYALSMRFDWHVALPDLPEVAGQGELSGDAGRLTTRQSLRLPHEAEVTASVAPDLEAGRHRFEVSGEWNEVAIAVGEEMLHSSQGRLAVQGEPDDYELALATRLLHPAIAGPVDLEITGQGDLDQLQVAQGLLLALGGETRFSGSLGWNPALAWEVSVQASAIDPGRQWPQWPGVLALDAAVRGSLAEDQLQVDVDMQHLQGKLRDYPVDARGQLSLLDDTFVLRTVKLQSGDNRVQLDGELQPALQLSFEIDASDLQQVAPMLAGSLQGRGNLQGSPADPAVNMSLRGKQLNLAGLLAGELALEADVDPADAERSHFRLQGKTLGFGEILLDTLELTGKGNTGQHQISAVTTGPDVEMNLTGAGRYDEQQWQGVLSLLGLKNNVLGHWQLEHPVNLQASNTELHIETLCLVKDQARLCASGEQRKDGSLRSTGELSGLPLDLLKHWLTEDTGIDGVVAGSFSLAGKPAQLQAQAKLQVSPGTLRYSPEDGPELIAEHHDGFASVDYRDDTLLAEFGLGLGDDGRLAGKGGLGPETDGQRALQGELDFRLSDPRPLGALAPQLVDWSGAMGLRGRLGGTLQQPTVQLHGDWRDGQVRVPELGITLSAIQLDMTGDGERVRLQGQAVSGKGQVTINGEAVLDSEAGWPVQLHIEGEDFQVVQRSELEVAVSPDIRVATEGQATSITGRLTVPAARIEIADIPTGVVRTSPDEVIIGMQQEPDEADRPQAHQVSAGLQLVLGEAVHLKAYGLDTRLTGELDLYQKPGAPTEANGQVHLVEGSYKGYGQDLSIEKGRLLFSGPLASANVDVRAVRKVKEVTAGILLTGPLTKPEAHLFSEPSMEEAEILSYLVTGGPLSGGQGANAAALTSAALGLGLDSANTITGQISGSLGLDELGIEGGEDDLEGSAMAIGKRLSPDLYVRYVYGLFDDTATLQLRYSLSKHLQVEVGTGQQQSADLLYEIERE
jgi:translocation and assembly module TamB